MVGSALRSEVWERCVPAGSVAKAFLAGEEVAFQAAAAEPARHGVVVCALGAERYLVRTSADGACTALQLDALFRILSRKELLAQERAHRDRLGGGTR